MKQQYSHIDKELLYRVITETAVNEEIEIVRKWIEADSENLSEFEQIKRLWETSKNIKNIENFDSRQALKSVREKIDRKNKQKGLKIRSTILKIAAILLLPLGLYIWFQYQSNNTKQMEQIIFVSNKKQELRLPDGTKVFLNTGTNIKYPKVFSGKQRAIEFSGEAYFEVVKNPEQPFIIKSNNSEVRVLGTAFNMDSKTENDEISVTVTEGKVKLIYKSIQGILLEKGETGLIRQSKSAITKSKTGNPNFLSWKTGKFEFTNTPLKNAVEDLAKFYTVEFLILNPKSNTILLTAQYDNLSIEDLKTILELTLNTQIDIENNRFIIR